VGLSCLLILCPACPAGADTLPGDVLYFVTDLGDLPGGYECCYPHDINELGQATGESCVDPSTREPFLWDIMALLLLVDPDQYAQSYPDCPGQWAGDINQDAVLDPADLYALREFLGSAPSTQPGHYVPPERILPMP